MTETIHSTRLAAIIQARAEIGPGDCVWIHADGCATMRDRQCDCDPVRVNHDDPRTSSEIERLVARAHRWH
jgi:hypothetical protein